MSQTFPPSSAPRVPEDAGDLWAPDDEGGERPPRRWRLVAGIAALTTVAIALPFLFRGGSSQPRTPAGTPGADSPGATRVGSVEFATYRDPQARFTIQYPRRWAVYGRVPGVGIPLDGSDPEVRLVLEAGTGGNSVLVRLKEFENPVTGPGLPDIKAVTDSIFSGIIAQEPARQIKVLDQRAITLNGMAGYYYLYTFVDPSGTQGVHTHYFLYQGRRLYQLVFQALPSEDLGRFSALFDQVAATFRTEPDPAPPPTR